jgi:hypothetical protein
MSPAMRDHLLKKYYLEGRSRQWTMQKLGITNTNSMSSVSARLYLHWSWPLENRKSGLKPGRSMTPAARPRTRTLNRKASGNALVNHSLKAKKHKPAIPAGETPPEEKSSRQGYYRYGKPMSVLSAERHKRGIFDPDSAIERSATFDGIDSDIAAAFAPYYK